MLTQKINLMYSASISAPYILFNFIKVKYCSGTDHVWHLIIWLWSMSDKLQWVLHTHTRCSSSILFFIVPNLNLLAKRNGGESTTNFCLHTQLVKYIKSKVNLANCHFMPRLWECYISCMVKNSSWNKLRYFFLKFIMK